MIQQFCINTMTTFKRDLPFVNLEQWERVMRAKVRHHTVINDGRLLVLLIKANQPNEFQILMNDIQLMNNNMNNNMIIINNNINNLITTINNNNTTMNNNINTMMANIHNNLKYNDNKYE
ncbi:hypothetical protein PPL_05954 [Heterostelium album PN500]|uniref:Uncharacterized protein n=1 Tax=Heterostelium pallidum (strain ATCC 26659 / Pp 5 / PN500) TaxID=670386 RepID=D3BBT5_HETP5|nr:hypothetical protein PPL_05954 [Heterostelium album PN500]EFA81118.1 hypothetical protein PPL_05954 [Heterostelium album PN500]|eukprot:XP_020433236.1 hypothetical protein PPL_05954 [Heterostelium album PN500]